MKKKFHLTAKTANKYDLYEESVQNVDFEVEFISKIYKKKNKTLCSSIREDFCASAKISSAWVQNKKNNVAYAIDLDPKILGFAKKSFKSRIRPFHLTFLTPFGLRKTCVRNQPEMHTLFIFRKNHLDEYFNSYVCVPVCLAFVNLHHIIMYSRVPNTSVGRNKRVGRKIS